MRAAPITSGQLCARCRRPMVPNGRPAARRSRPPGTVVHRAHGLCETCGHVRGTYRAGRDPKGLDVDDIAVERAARGERLPLNRLERIAAVELLKSRNYTHREIARRIGLSERVVQRYVTALKTQESTT